MLAKFLEDNEAEILSMTKGKTRRLAGVLGRSHLLDAGIPVFYSQLIDALKKGAHGHSQEMLSSAAEHGKELLRLGYTLSHVVHAYGAMCQSVTELATIKNTKISASDFSVLNSCLDVAISSAVSEYQFRSEDAQEKREVLHLGFLAHELRNALSCISVAHQMIKAGLVGVGGSTAAVLEANISRMEGLIDRSLSEVRLRSDSNLLIETFSVSELFDEILVTAQVTAGKRNQDLTTDGDANFDITADRQYILSAVGNLVQNAMKYTKTGGRIWLRAKLVKDRVLIEIQDECGGLDMTKVKSLFEPYVQENADRSGLGLGLSIAQRAVHLSQGEIGVENHPGSGCTFIIELPQKIDRVSRNKRAVSGKNSVQPK